MNTINENGHDRREFLKKGAFYTTILGSGLWPTIGCGIVSNEGNSKNIIFLVSDGMSSGTLTMADIMLRRRDGRASNWLRLYEEGRAQRALMDMASADRIVTCSAAASSSWGCGQRVNNGVVNVGTDGEEYPPIVSIMRDSGKSTGLVTTARVTHATPAGFAANVEDRDMEDEIALQYLDRKVDVLLGGGNSDYDPEKREDGRDLYSEYRAAGYHVARHKTELLWKGAPTDRLLGIFAEGHLPYTLDHINTPDLHMQVPTLAEMTDIALHKLSKNPNGFIIQIEGARVDHAAHGNDIGGLIYDQIAFDEAIGVVLDFVENRNDTLVIITTDHGNANPGFNSGPDASFDRIQQFRHSSSWIQSKLDHQSTIAQIRDRVYAATGIGITRDEAKVYLQATRGTYSPVYRRMSGRSSVLGQILANYTNVNWVGGSHTADYVELCSFGPGSEALKGFVINTSLFDVMTEAAGVREMVMR
jgi:alkaline phosphatase